MLTFGKADELPFSEYNSYFYRVRCLICAYILHLCFSFCLVLYQLQEYTQPCVAKQRRCTAVSARYSYLQLHTCAWSSQSEELITASNFSSPRRHRRPRRERDANPLNPRYLLISPHALPSKLIQQWCAPWWLTAVWVTNASTSVHASNNLHSPMSNGSHIKMNYCHKPLN